VTFPFGLGYRHDLNDHRWIVRNQLRFAGTAMSRVSVPASIDPRPDQWVKFQGQTSQCHGYSRSSGEERLAFLTTGAKARFSAHFAAMTNEEQDGTLDQGDCGGSISGSLAAAASKGICDETECPSDVDGTPSWGDGQIPAAAAQQGLTRLIKSHTAITSAAMGKQYIGSVGVIQVGFIVGPIFMNLKSGTILTPDMIRQDEQSVQQDPHSGGGHALVLVGYEDDNFWLQNSWDKTWCDGGYCLFAADSLDYLGQSAGQGVNDAGGMSHLSGFDEPSQAIDFKGIFI
jgi:hypothetical protein